MLAYAATIPLSTRSLAYLSGLLAAHRREIGPARRAGLGLAGVTRLIHDLKAARTHGLMEALTRSAVATLADKGLSRCPRRGRRAVLRLAPADPHARGQHRARRGPRHRRTSRGHAQDLAAAHQAALLSATCPALVAAILTLHLHATS